MGSMKFAQNHKIVNVLPPDADRFGAAGSTMGAEGPRGAVGAASPTTGIVDVRNYRHATFIVVYGEVAASTTTITLEGCDALYSPTIHTELAFEYYPGGTGTTGSIQSVEKLGTMALATTAGLLTTSGTSGQIVVIEVDVAEAEAAYKATNATSNLVGLRLTCTESKDAPADGCVLCILSDPRYAADGDDMPQGLSNGA